MASLDSSRAGFPARVRPGPSPDGPQAERLSALSPVLLAVADQPMRLIFTSPALQRALGWTGEELAGRNWLELLDAEDLADAGTALGQARETHGIEVTLRGAHRHPARASWPGSLDRGLRRRLFYARRGHERARRAEGAPGPGDRASAP